MSVAAVAVRSRVAAVDALRGAAILLMVADHVVWAVDPYSVLRLATRPALPMFLIVSGWLWRPGAARGGRYLDVVMAALAAEALTALLGMPSPNILVVWALVWPLMPWISRAPVVAAVAGILAALYLPIPWHGYQPGLVAAYLALGRLVNGWGSWTWAPLECLGRYPLSVYVGHLAVLAAILSV